MTDYKRLSYKQRCALLARAVARHGWRCIICGLPIAPRDQRPGRTTLEHRVPRSKGGDDSPANTGPAHASCNYSRQDKNLTVEIHDGAAFFWSENP